MYEIIICIISRIDRFHIGYDVNNSFMSELWLNRRQFQVGSDNGLTSERW